MGASLDPGLLAGLVAGGVGLVVALTHLSGGTRTRALSEAEARQRFAGDFPDARIAAVQLADDARAALLALEGGGVGLVFALGDGVVTRRLPPGTPLREAGEALEVRTGDFGAPRVRVCLGAEHRAAWRRRLEA